MLGTTGATHVRRCLAVVCMWKAMWFGHVQGQLIVMFKPKAILEGHIRHHITFLCRPKALREGYAWRLLTIEKAKGNEGRQCRMSPDHYLEAKGIAGSKGSTTIEQCAQALEDWCSLRRHRLSNLQAMTDVGSPRLRLDGCFVQCKGDAVRKSLIIADWCA